MMKLKAVKVKWLTERLKKMDESLTAFTAVYLMFGAMFLLGLLAIFMWIKRDEDDRKKQLNLETQWSKE